MLGRAHEGDHPPLFVIETDACVHINILSFTLGSRWWQTFQIAERHRFQCGIRRVSRTAADERRAASEPGAHQMPTDPRYPGVPLTVPEEARARFLALRPGGPLTRRFFLPQNTVMVVGGSVFVHGGVLPHHLDVGLDDINRCFLSMHGRSSLVA